MKTVDKIRRYIEEECCKGHLQPGDRLPIYREMMAITGSSYVTVVSAMDKLRQSGLVEISNGNGSYLSGGRMLDVDFNTSLTNLPEALLQQLFAEHLEGLNLNLSIKPVQRFRRQDMRKTEISANRPAFYMWKQNYLFGLPLTRLNDQPEYDSLACSLEMIPGQISDLALPMVYYPYHLGVNGRLLRKTSLKPEDLTSNFQWWPRYAREARQAGFHPHSVLWYDNGFNAILSFVSPLLRIAMQHPERLTDETPLFASPNGQLLLQLAKNCLLYRHPGPETFFGGGSGMNLLLGSWIVRQNRRPEYPGVEIDDLFIVPYTQGRKRIHCVDVEYLSMYVPEHLTAGEKQRMWKAFRLLFARPFQLAYCNAAGVLSTRKDIGGRDYTWNGDGQWDGFVPRANDCVMQRHGMFPQPVTTSLSLLLEDAIAYGSNPQTILQRMDEKKNFAGIGQN